ncbi:hypothetical protein [Sphingobacterium faecium]|uniref:hypothetical protein n=1 Tax=Sphingobacterium faecium TaxID=34087 RepID=UPI001474A697|nr:hypothetical protein [Sphingobacterium faecium]
MDKEFESLFPPEPNGKGVRFVDKFITLRFTCLFPVLSDRIAQFAVADSKRLLSTTND